MAYTKGKLKSKEIEMSPYLDRSKQVKYETDI
jgi:hypothetical protein